MNRREFNLRAAAAAIFGPSIPAAIKPRIWYPWPYDQKIPIIAGFEDLHTTFSNIELREIVRKEFIPNLHKYWFTFAQRYPDLAISFRRFWGLDASPGWVKRSWHNERKAIIVDEAQREFASALCNCMSPSAMIRDKDGSWRSVPAASRTSY